MRENGKTEEEVKEFEKNAQPYAKKILDEIGKDKENVQFYIGESGVTEDGVQM